MSWREIPPCKPYNVLDLPEDKRDEFVRIKQEWMLAKNAASLVAMVPVQGDVTREVVNETVNYLCGIFNPLQDRLEELGRELERS